MTESKGISAIIPTYKGEAFISKLLDSLIDDYKNGLICYIPPRWKLIKDRNF